ncbi:Trifunctional nucleotide phosphoesterase protein YfkN precursor [Porphyromonas crevioricanis]|uniref:Trifunctional nucleotide phosphoesterase protein YfkN n=1 Tax=Porphyromonas crevioricanis TaxID=393921 RepID=A0A2X4PEU8_9PORP|nr:bifunctional metallophosphatase/5'-nucleotidase [Porphyromonas crevioricanis]SQH72324.1 Trifunctional nucleotide phosphoesterase protein YfkN precursor [Porphyromonas crevioricanis]
MSRFILFCRSLIAAWGVFCCVFLSACSGERTTEIRIIHTTDIHGNYFSFDFLADSAGTGSMSRLSSFLKEARKQNPSLLLIDGGDILQGTPAAYYSNYADTLPVNLAAQTMNYLRFDASVVGNHDIETGHEVYDSWIKDCKFPVLAANMIDIETDKPYLPPYTIKDIDGIRVAILGFVTPAIPEWLPQDLWRGVGFEDILISAQQWVPYVIEHEKPDILIGLLHSGLKNTNRHYIENAGELLAKEVSGFDALFIGHDHRKFNGQLRTSRGDSVHVCNPASHLDFASDLTIRVTRKGNKIVAKDISSRLVDLNQYEPDPAFERAFSEQQQAVRKWANRQVGVLETPLDIRGSLFGPTPFLSLIHRVQLDATGADISFASPLDLHTYIPAGPLRVRDLFSLYRFENFLYVMELTGSEVKDYLEFSYGKWANHMKGPKDHLLLFRTGITPQDKFKTLHEIFNYSSAAGIDYTVDVSKPAGDRVKILKMSNGQPFDYSKVYRVALDSFRGGGGGDLLTEGCQIRFEELARRIVEEKDDIRSYVHKYIVDKGSIEVQNNANWRFVPETWVREAIERDTKIMFP